MSCIFSEMQLTLFPLVKHLHSLACRLSLFCDSLFDKPFDAKSSLLLFDEWLLRQAGNVVFVCVAKRLYMWTLFHF